jgi:hypothetical protein
VIRRKGPPQFHLVELLPVLQTASTDEVPARLQLDRAQTMASLSPLTLDGSEAVECLLTREGTDEVVDLRVGMKLDESVNVRHTQRSQEQPLSLDHVSEHKSHRRPL